MDDGSFDIYQTDAGYAAVMNPVQRLILDSLRSGEKQLPELVEITGRSKPTLSSLHMKELLARELIEERSHPTDSRRKVYRVRSTKIGSSDVPVAQLRDAVKHYVGLSPLAARLPLRASLEAIAAAPPGAQAVVHAQARALGRLASGLVKGASARDLGRLVVRFLEDEQLVQPVGGEAGSDPVELRAGPALAATALWAPTLLAGFIEGIGAGRLKTQPGKKRDVVRVQFGGS